MLFTSGYDYGNARLRARRAALLSGAEIEQLLDLDLDGIAGALSTTDYRGALERVAVRSHGAARIHNAVRLHLATELEGTRRMYEDEAKHLVDLALADVDLHNTLVLLRAHIHGGDREAAVVHLVPLGNITDALAREVLRQPEFAAAVQLIVRWKLPDPETARVLRMAWPLYEVDRNIARLEHALCAATAARVIAGARAARADGAELLRAAGREADERNLIVALRAQAGSATEPAFLPQTWLDLQSLSRAATEPALGAAVAGLATVARDSWRRPLERYAAGGDLTELELELERHRLVDTVARFDRGDPLGFGIPLAWITATTLEARNLRLVAERAERDMNPDLIRPLLIFADRTT